MLKLFQKRVSEKNKKLIKGLCLSITILFISLCTTPIQIYASEQTQIVPTWNWGSQYSSQFTVTNFCEGSGTSVSCELRFTANNSYYGYLSFDGYNGTTKWIDYKNVWIADGYGAYRYSLYQNGVIQINKINIEGGYIKSSMDNLDLQDIIDLLTAIETDTTSIDNQMNTELQRLQSIINNQVIQNGYLATLTQLRQWNIPFESWNYVLNTFMLGYEDYEVANVNYFQMPLFHINDNNLRLLDRYNYFRNQDASENEKTFILYIDCNVWNRSQWFTFFEIKDSSGNVLIEGTDYSLNDFEIIQQRIMPSSPNYFTVGNIIKFDIQNISSSDKVMDLYFKYNVNNVRYYMPIYSNVSSNRNISTDFALVFGLSNELLNDLGIIAQGTTESNSAASGLDSETSSFESVASGLYTSENSFNQNMNSSLQSIDTSFNPSTSFGSKFLYSADWVRSQFNTITSNTPFGSVLSFSMLLGLSLLIIGKVFK